ncbi:MAG: cobalt-precorrin-5B (C(1))-methyltransferase CbiD [Lachnospiraceae bacterium]
MRYGFTTGSCAAAAAKAAAYMLLTGKEKTEMRIDTPKGISFLAEILEIERQENKVLCAVRKDGGDDPDITTGALIFAEVSFGEKNQKTKIWIDGGKGVGRVTRPGLDQPVGNAAINHVPREMIEKEVLEVCQLVGYQGNLNVIVSVPQGEELAEHTFNPRLGIVGGISILGTSGIVEPMSSQALLDTIRVELNMHRTLGETAVAVSPGNYGLDFMKQQYGYDLDKSVKCSNFIGDTIDMAIDMGFEQMLLTGHIGKLVKLAGGIMNTHSKEGDCRMELMVAAGIRANVPIGILQQILDCVTTTDALRLLQECDKIQETMAILMDKIMFYLRKREKGKLQIECIVYDNVYGELGKSKGAEELLKNLAVNGI